MSPKHPRPRVAHDCFDLVAPRALIAMDGTIGARRFLFAEPAPVESLRRVILELLALGTKRVVRVMEIAAIDPDHRRHGFPFARQAAIGKVRCGGGRFEIRQ